MIHFPYRAKPAKPPRSGSLASQADKYKCYEASVQCVEAEIDMVDDSYRRITGKPARILREDFCGTANTSCEWVRRRKSNRAIGVDLDKEVLQWGQKNHIEKLSENQQSRITLLEQNVLDPCPTPVDMVLAMNFSYQIFCTRESLGGYFRKVYEGLKQGGVFFIDAYGGRDSIREIKEKTKHKKLNYYWHQARYDPISGLMLCYIHFRFRDGSWLKRAFSYQWRLWTLPEVRELLEEAGFRNITVYWEGTDADTGEGNGVYSPATVGEDDPAWVVYISARKQETLT